MISMPAMVAAADQNDLKPSIGRVAVTVLDVGAVDYQADQVARSVSDDVTLAAFDLADSSWGTNAPG
jgi:hypothetical protein